LSKSFIVTGTLHGVLIFEKRVF